MAVTILANYSTALNQHIIGVYTGTCPGTKYSTCRCVAYVGMLLITLVAILLGC